MIEIPVKGRKGEQLIAFIDDEDFELVNQYKWVAGGKSPADRSWFYAYASNHSGKENILMHRLVMNAKQGVFIDHRNRNRLDNQKGNLRFCTRSQNMMNQVKRTSRKYKGVYPSGKNGFRVLIGVNYKLTSVGSYKTEFEAAKAYDEAAIRLHGEFASLNFPA